jgi:formylglycine-generating enzyme required for sulfatase activity
MKAETAALALAILAAAFSPADDAIAAPAWKPAYSNPMPAPDDVALPLPCGGEIVLRKIVTNPAGQDTTATAPLADREVVMGRATDGARGYMESRHEEHVAGPISERNGERFYYLGKYEVSTAQYDAVMADPAHCPKPADTAREPKANVSWYDAVEFTRRVNRFLFVDANGIGAVAALGIPDGYVRLPTETEWEFAVRGGLSVGDAERADNRFPVPEGIEAYAWVNASQAGSGDVAPIGTRLPNPLGLYDVYGNLEEMMLEPFRMTRADRLHGLVGGFIGRGGSFLDAPDKINSALREEHPYFLRRLQGEFRTRSIGFRIAVGTAALSTDTNTTALQAAAAAVSRQDPASVAPDAPERLAALAAATENAELKATLEDVRLELANEFARRNDLEGRQTRGSIVNAAMVARELSLAARGLDMMWDQIAGPDANDDSMALFKPRFDANLESFRMFRRTFVDGIAALAALSPERIGAEFGHVRSELGSSGRGQLVPFVDIVSREVGDYADGRVTETRAMIETVIGRDHAWNRGN